MGEHGFVIVSRRLVGISMSPVRAEGLEVQGLVHDEGWHSWAWCGAHPPSLPLPSLDQSIRPHVWYFVIADCDAKDHPTTLKYRLELFNSDGTHFSHEDRAPSQIYPLLLVIFWLTLIPLGMLIQGHMKRVGASRLHPALQHLILGLALFLASLILRTLDYRRFSQDGVGFKACNVLGEMANWMAQLVVSLELLSIAWAWSVDFIVSPTRKQVAGKKVLTRIVVVIILLHIILILLSRQYDDAHHKHHESETIPALLLVSFRLLLGGAFFYGISILQAREYSLLQKSFVTRLSVAGGAYFISIPIVVILASTLLPPYLRHQMVALGSLSVQMIALVSLAVLFLTRNEFTEISTLTASALPITSPKRS